MKQFSVVTALALGLLFSCSLAAEPLTLLDTGGIRIRFIESSAPSVSLGTLTVTGMQPGEVLAAIDYRPANGLLYAVGVLEAGPARLYTINTATGAATLVGNGPFDTFIGFRPIGMDFNPVTDRIRIIANGGASWRLNPNDGTAVFDTSVSFAPGDPNAGNQNAPLSLAYSNNFRGAASTTLYGIVSGNGPFLVTVGSPGGSPTSPNSGQMFTVGQTGLGGYFTLQQSLEISASGTAYMVVDNDNILYRVNLATGQATAIGPFPSGSKIFGISAPIPPARRHSVRSS